VRVGWALLTKVGYQGGIALFCRVKKESLPVAVSLIHVWKKIGFQEFESKELSLQIFYMSDKEMRTMLVNVICDHVERKVLSIQYKKILRLLKISRHDELT
jgi:hypothetical protein